MKFLPWTRSQRVVAARPKATEAGSKGKSAVPLTINERLANYAHQCGRPVGHGLTPAQSRRSRKKLAKYGH